MDLVHQLTGEVLSVEEYLDASRVIEREIGKLDRALVDCKEESKELKMAREKAVKDLRAIVREMNVVAPRGRRGRR